MDLAQWANVGELLGGIGVIISLLYLAYQIRGSSRAQKAESYARALERLSSVQGRLAQDASFNELLNVGLMTPDQLSLNQRTQLTWLFTEMFGAFEFMYLQSEEGNLPDVIWDQWQTTMRWWLTFEGARRWWKGRPAPFSRPFTELVDSCLEEHYEMPNTEQWNNWLATGFAEPRLSD